MNRYEPSTPRAAFGVVAVAMTALTVVLSVVAPARVSPGSRDAGLLAARDVAATERVEVAIIPSRIDVVAQRGRSSVFGVVHHGAPPKDQTI